MSQTFTGDTIWQARGDSARFSFEAYGRTEHDAIQALYKGLAVHARQYQLEPNWHKGTVDVATQQITLGSAYRDNQPLRS